MLAAVRIVIGLLLLLLGRRLFWLFVAGIGFVVAVELVGDLVGVERVWLLVVIGLVAGIVGALVAVFLQKVAVGIAGFLAGAYLLLSLLNALGMEGAILAWVLALVGGIIGAVVAVWLLPWALIVLSSLSGSALIAQSLPLTPTTGIIVFVVAAVIGILVQARTMET
jgi:hypothetical protein